MHLPKQCRWVLGSSSLNDLEKTDEARDTSSGVAEDGILPGKIDNDFRSCSDLLFDLLTTESFCSAVRQRCQGQGGQDVKQNRITRGGGVKIG